LASAKVLPKSVITEAVSNKLSSKEIAKKFGASPDPVE
jgi:hypothetical protein